MAHAAEEQYERKLRPIYDALDARSWKQAAKLADGVLKKHKGDQLVRALKAYALHRSGKAEEALQLMRDIVSEGPDSERIVMTMTYTYKAAGQLGGITQAYAAAAEKHPKDPEIMAGLFRAHVREFDFVRQQQAAMKLSKLAPAGSAEAAGYSWWVVTSLALQARAALLGQDQQGRPLAAGAALGATGGAAAPGGGLPPDKLLQLAESMAGRQAKAAEATAAAKQGPAGKVAAMAAASWTYEALLLYLDILQGQGKAREALQVLEGPLVDAVPLPADRVQLRAAALVRAGDLPAAAACYRQALSAEPDDWLSWQLFLDCSLPGSGGSQGSGAAGVRFPVGVVGGLADLWDQRQPAAAPLTGQEQAAAVAAVEDALAALQAEVAGSEAWKAAAQRGTLRAPHLWHCELLLRRLRLAGAAGDAAQQAALRRQLGQAAAEAFGSLAGNFSCVADLRPYLAQLSGEEAEQLAAAAHRLAAEANAADEAAAPASGSEASEAVGNGDSAPAAPGPAAANSSAASGGSGASGEVRRLQRQVSALSLEAELGLPRLGSASEAAVYAQRLLELYRRHMHLSASLDEKERGYGEDLVALAAAALVRGAAAAAPADAGQLVGPLLQALLVLEAAQQRRKVSAPLRLAATALYSLLGAPSLASAQFAALDIKSILHDSLTGHWLLPLAAAAGGEDAGELRRWVEGTALLHDLHQQEAGESLATALQHGTYSKVPEFVDFKERLQRSHARALAAVLQALQPAASDKPAGGSTSLTSLYRLGSPEARQAALQHARSLLLASNAAEGAADGAAEGKAAGPQLCFNEDLSTRPAWFPPGPAGGSAVAGWWEAAVGSGQPAAQHGYAACWWSVPQAAQGGSPEVAAWRSGCLGELRVRLAWALIASANLASASDAAALAQQIQPLLAASGSSDGASRAAPATGLQAAACVAVLGLLQAVGGDAAADLAPAQQLGEACSANSQRLAAQLAAEQSLPVLPGGAVSPATAVVSECLAIAAVCSKLKKLASKAAPAAAAAAGAVAAAATAAACEVKQAAAAAAAALEEEQRVQAALALIEGGSGSCGGDEGGQLWGFEPAFQAQPVVEALVRGQLAALRSL